MYSKEDRSKFKYWYAHWKAYQMIAKLFGVWKFKYLFHDIEKPFMLYWYMYVRGLKHEDAYKKVQKWHREHNRHHLEYKGKHKDYDAMIIDWECSRFTKKSSPLTAYEEFERKLRMVSCPLTDKDIFEIQSALIKVDYFKFPKYEKSEE